VVLSALSLQLVMLSSIHSCEAQNIPNIVATLESHVALSTGLLYDLSPQQLAMCSPNPDSCGGTGECGGAAAEIAYDYLAGSRGAVQEYEVSYEAYDERCGYSSSNCEFS
jgi:hypothetical protein